MLKDARSYMLLCTYRLFSGVSFPGGPSNPFASPFLLPATYVHPIFRGTFPHRIFTGNVSSLAGQDESRRSIGVYLVGEGQQQKAAMRAPLGFVDPIRMHVQMMSSLLLFTRERNRTQYFPGSSCSCSSGSSSVRYAVYHSDVTCCARFTTRYYWFFFLFTIHPPPFFL